MSDPSSFYDSKARRRDWDTVGTRGEYRRWNNRAKQGMIDLAMDAAQARFGANLNVVECGVGNGGDLMKWSNGARKRHLTLRMLAFDPAESAVALARHRWWGDCGGDCLYAAASNGFAPMYVEAAGGMTVRFVHGDMPLVQLWLASQITEAEAAAGQCRCFRASAEERRRFARGGQDRWHVLSCQLAAHYFMDSQEAIGQFFGACDDLLLDGGIVLVSIPNADAIIRAATTPPDETCARLQIDFDAPEFPSARTHAPYRFRLDNVVDAVEHVVPHRAFLAAAEAHGFALSNSGSFPEWAREASQRPLPQARKKRCRSVDRCAKEGAESHGRDSSASTMQRRSSHGDSKGGRRRKGGKADASGGRATQGGGDRKGDRAGSRKCDKVGPSRPKRGDAFDVLVHGLYDGYVFVKRSVVRDGQ